MRSLGSVSLRMSERAGIKFHFNYFVADFNEVIKLVKNEHTLYIYNENENILLFISMLSMFHCIS